MRHEQELSLDVKISYGWPWPELSKIYVCNSLFKNWAVTQKDFESTAMERLDF